MTGGDWKRDRKYQEGCRKGRYGKGAQARVGNRYRLEVEPAIATSRWRHSGRRPPGAGAGLDGTGRNYRIGVRSCPLSAAPQRGSEPPLASATVPSATTAASQVRLPPRWPADRGGGGVAV